MNKKLRLAAAVGMTALLLWGCQMKKEETVNVVTKQPVLGEDVSGYEGFAYLSAYTLEGEAPSVLYLPADENAYVGGTCIISKKEGVEVTLNLNPLLSEEFSNKNAKQKLKYMLDSEYSDTYIQNFSELEISDIESLENGGVKARVSYLVYDDAKKGYVGQWLEYYLVELEDGRSFKAVLRVDSDSETQQSGSVVEELEKYFETDFSYEGGFLQAKIDGYAPGEDELLRINGTTVPFGEFNIYLPEGWEKNTMFDLMPDATFYGENGESMNQNRMIYTVTLDANGNTAELGALTKGEEKILEQEFEKMLIQQFGNVDVEVTVIGMTDLGYVFTAYIEDYINEGSLMYLYYICRGNKIYGLGGLLVRGSIDKNELTQLVELIDGIYSSMEVR